MVKRSRSGGDVHAIAGLEAFPVFHVVAGQLQRRCCPAPDRAYLR